MEINALQQRKMMKYGKLGGGVVGGGRKTGEGEVSTVSVGIS